MFSLLQQLPHRNTLFNFNIKLQPLILYTFLSPVFEARVSVFVIYLLIYLRPDVNTFRHSDTIIHTSKQHTILICSLLKDALATDKNH